MMWQEVEEDKKYNETWVCGEPNLGCGVYKIGEEWAGVVIIYNVTCKMPSRTTKEEAMKYAEAHFNRLYEVYHEEVN